MQMFDDALYVNFLEYKKFPKAKISARQPETYSLYHLNVYATALTRP